MKGEHLVCKKCGYDFIDFANKRQCPKCNATEFRSKRFIEITEMRAWIE